MHPKVCEPAGNVEEYVQVRDVPLPVHVFRTFVPSDIVTLETETSSVPVHVIVTVSFVYARPEGETPIAKCGCWSRFTVIVFDTVSVAPLLSVTVSVTVYVPAAVYR